VEPDASQEKFDRADRLYQANRFEESLLLLAELDKEFPNTKHILYPMALCLERLGRADEALQLCNLLIQRFQDERAHVLKARIVTAP